MFPGRSQIRSLTSLCVRLNSRTSLAETYRRLPARRTMSTAPSNQPELKQYLILVPDHSKSLSVRKATKAAHIKSATPLIDDGRLPYFGVTLARHQATAGAESGPRKDGTNASPPEPEINGSVMVLHAASEEAVRDFLANDPYAQQGVWDVANAQILPFKAG